MGRQHTMAYLGAMAWIGAAMGDPAVIISKMTRLPPTVENGKPYPVSYRFMVNPIAARYIKKIAVYPICGSGPLGLGGGCLFKETTSTCNSVNRTSHSCLWSGQFTAIVPGPQQIELGYVLGGVAWRAQAQTRQTTVSMPDVTAATTFDNDRQLPQPAGKWLAGCNHLQKS